METTAEVTIEGKTIKRIKTLVKSAAVIFGSAALVVGATKVIHKNQ